MKVKINYYLPSINSSRKTIRRNLRGFVLAEPRKIAHAVHEMAFRISATAHGQFVHVGHQRLPRLVVQVRFAFIEPVLFLFRFGFGGCEFFFAFPVQYGVFCV